MAKIIQWLRHYVFLGNGYITTDILRGILSELDPNLTADELDEMIDEIDEDSSGTVDFDGKPSN